MALFTKSKHPVEVATPAPAAGRPLPPDDPELERAIQRRGTEFLTLARQRKGNVLSAAFWSDKLMDWAMKDEAFKVQLFRFIDTFPRLATPEQVHEHLVDYLEQPGVTLPPGLGVGLKAGGLVKGAMSKTIEGRITAMAKRFIAGTDARSAEKVLRSLWDRDIAFSVDLLGEACVSAPEAEAYQAKYLDLVDHLPEVTAGWPDKDLLERDHLGPIPRANVSVKISSLAADTDPIDTDGAIARLMEALAPILNAAARHGVLINFDMEQFELKDLTLELFMRCCEAIDFPAGLAMQAYLRSGDDDAQRIIDWSKRTGRQVTVRLVKGAYWDYETIHAEEHGWPVPVWSRKPDSDACFERMTRALIAATPRAEGHGGVKLALGSHNARSIACALAALEREDLPTNALELQMLYGMAEALKDTAVEMGLRVREYVPVGEMIPGMAYLVRRLLENTSNESWLRAGFAEDASVEDLLATPHRQYDGVDPGVERIERAPERHRLTDAVEGVDDGRPFMSEPMRDFAHADVRDRFRVAVAGATVPDVALDATEDDAERALAAAHAAIPAWRAKAPRDRSAVLIRAATAMRRRRDELCGVMIREAGKTWREADAEVCEAIDFCTFYAREAVGLFEPRRLGRFVGELDQVVHTPRGVAIVIAPWNFPLAILCGMTVASLVTGNPTIMKPSQQTLGIARLLYEILIDAGCPPDVLHFMPGDGHTVGAKLVADPRTALIAFTGSMGVGLGILETAGRTLESQSHVKKVVCEMGGKNAIIVDASADLDEAVVAVRYGAFGYQGQKCSACSRVIVLSSTYDVFLERLLASTQSLVVGDPLNPAVDVGPVIDPKARASIEQSIEIGKTEATLALAMPMPDASRLAPGRDYVTPHVFTDVPTDGHLANHEIFGPVLSVFRVDTFDEALDLANATRFALTGGLFSRKPSNIERVRREYRVGNLYINRSITGALVGRQPFGGLQLSGVGTKAGGREYLHHFVEPRSICENTMRRGFAPEL